MIRNVVVVQILRLLKNSTFSHPKSGSFIRPNKAYGGITAIQAIKDRYGLKQDQNGGVDSEELFVLDQNFQQTPVEMVGARKVNLLQR